MSMDGTNELTELRKAFPDIWVREDGSFRTDGREYRGDNSISWEPGNVEHSEPRVEGEALASGLFHTWRVSLRLSQLVAITNYICAFEDKRRHREWEMSLSPAAEGEESPAALTPAPQAHPGSGHGEIEGDVLAEFMKRPGAVRWTGGFCPVDDVKLDVLWRNCVNGELYSEQHYQTPGVYHDSWAHKDRCDTIIAYEIISEPASSPHAEGYAPVVGEGAATPPEGYWLLSPSARCVCANLWTDGAGGYYCCGAGAVTFNPDPLSISASETHAAESERLKEAMDAIAASIPLPELGPDTVATQTYVDGDQLVVREITAGEFYAQPEINVTPPASNEGKEADANFWMKHLVKA